MSNEINIEKMENSTVNNKEKENCDVLNDIKQDNKCSSDKLKIDEMSINENSTGIAIKNVESDALRSILEYDSDSSYSSETEMSNFEWRTDKKIISQTSSTSSSSSSSEDDNDEDDDGDEDDVQEIKCDEHVEKQPNRGAIKKNKPPSKSTGEMDMDDLPPVPDLSTLSLNVEHEKFVHMGNILGIVDRLVTVAALHNTPAYDLETLLFLDNGKRPLGFVFDVLGQVTAPIYAIRFNSIEDIKNLNIKNGMEVFAAPTSKHTQYVFLQQLLRMKGSDASWFADNEVPPEFVDYSDDENEFYGHSGHSRIALHSKRSNDDYKEFEITMNKRNLLNTKLNKYMDSYRQSRQRGRVSGRGPTAPQIHTTASTVNSSTPVVFDPTIPPPNMRPFCTPNLIFHSPGEYLVMHQEGNNNRSSQQQQPPQQQQQQLQQQQQQPVSFFGSGFVANLEQAATYFTNHEHPGPSHQ